MSPVFRRQGGGHKDSQRGVLGGVGRRLWLGPLELCEQRGKGACCGYSKGIHRHLERKAKCSQAGEMSCGEVEVEGSEPEKEVGGRGLN